MGDHKSLTSRTKPTENRLSGWSDIIHHMGSHDPLDCKICKPDCPACQAQLESDIKITGNHLNALQDRLGKWESKRTIYLKIQEQAKNAGVVTE